MQSCEAHDGPLAQIAPANVIRFSLPTDRREQDVAPVRAQRQRSGPKIFIGAGRGCHKSLVVSKVEAVAAAEAVPRGGIYDGSSIATDGRAAGQIEVGIRTERHECNFA